jgi:hypothetical protein
LGLLVTVTAVQFIVDGARPVLLGILKATCVGS